MEDYSNTVIRNASVKGAFTVQPFTTPTPTGVMFSNVYSFLLFSMFNIMCGIVALFCFSNIVCLNCRSFER